MKSVDRILATLLFIFHFSFLFSLGTEYEYPLRLITSVFLGACCTKLWKKMKKTSKKDLYQRCRNLEDELLKLYLSSISTVICYQCSKKIEMENRTSVELTQEIINKIFDYEIDS